jgi:hypothetical protein
MGLTAAASTYLVIDLLNAGYRQSAKEWQDERDAQTAAAPVKRPRKPRNVRAEPPADDEEVQTTPRYQPRLLPNEDGCGVWDSWVPEWVKDEPGRMLGDVYAECDELNEARALAPTG